MPATLAELARRFDCELRGDGDVVVETVGTLTGAGGDAVTFLANPLYRKQLHHARAAAVILGPALVDECPVPVLVSENPYATYARVARFLVPAPARTPGVHETAVIADDAVLSKDVHVGPHVTIGAGASLGAGVAVEAGAVIGPNVSLGERTRIEARAVLMDDCRVGARCVVHAGAVIGSDGFGFAHEDSHWIAVPQLGRVVIGDDVDIGANTTIDRGTIEDTVIESGVKLDNLIQVAHNVHIGAHTAMAAMSGVAGSARIGARCMIGGAVVIVGHISICDDVMVTFHSSVLRSISEPGTYSSGIDAEPASRWRRNSARLRRLDESFRSMSGARKPRGR
jgi:UDP-3-O-[3-hydroxymyristoyl] glucosamine N-acyltransferase